MRLFLRDNGNWSAAWHANTGGALPAGTHLRSRSWAHARFTVNGTSRLASATIRSPAVIQGSWPTAWPSHRLVRRQLRLPGHYQSTSSGIQSYSMLSANDGYGPQTLRVVQPTHPAAGVAHNFLFVLPVETGLGNTYGDGLATLQATDAQDKYNLTIIEPTFSPPWYANDPTDPNLQYETFMTNELVPWVKHNLATSGTEQNWLIGFSKSGFGGQTSS